MQSIMSLLPKKIAQSVEDIPPAVKDHIEEIRIRIHRPIEITVNGKPSFLPHNPTPDEAQQLLQKISNHSIYAMEEELMRGYITVPGGHRIGLAGKVILEQGKVRAIRDVSSFNIRIAREKPGIAIPLIPSIFNGNWMHTMIIGPPQTGKTTLLRDIARLISSGLASRGIESMKVGIVDERSEIAGCVRGIPQLTFGPRIDILDACPKAEGMMMMIRSMSPEVLVVDEIGRSEDAVAIMEAVHAGIKLITTIHGSSLEEVRSRPILKEILNLGIFERFIILERAGGPGTISKLLDGEGRQLSHKVRVT